LGAARIGVAAFAANIQSEKPKILRQSWFCPRF
jgi:hypothetical protein